MTYHEQFWGVSYKLDVLFCLIFLFISFNVKFKFSALGILSLLVTAFILFYFPSIAIFIMLPAVVLALVLFLVSHDLRLGHFIFFSLFTVFDWHVMRFDEPYMWSLVFSGAWLLYSFLVCRFLSGWRLYKASILFSTLALIMIPAATFYGFDYLEHNLKNYFYQIWYSFLAIQVIALSMHRTGGKCTT